MKVRTILLSMVLVAGVSLNVSAQFKIGGKSINTKKLVNAASDVAKAVTLSDVHVLPGTGCSGCAGLLPYI